jgi:hypothetical protein
MPQKAKNSDVNPNRDEFDASNAEELDALEVNLAQDGDDFRASDDGTGLIDDELAEERIEGLTEVGPDLENKGVVNAVPGRDDTSTTLRRHYANSGIARDQDVEEDNLDEPRDEMISGRQGDEDTAA